jgi:hypothetical protein
MEANHQFLAAALEALRHRVAGTDAAAAVERRDELAGAMSTPPAIDGIAAAFGLSPFERDVLLLSAGVELETTVARACATAHGDPARPYATFSLAMGTLSDSHWSATTPAAPLRRWHLVELSHPELPTTSPLRIDERLLHALTGIAYLDPRIEALAEPLLPSPLLPSPPLSATLRTVADRLVAAWSSADTRGVHLSGRRQSDLRAVVSTASTDLNLLPVCLRAADLPAPPAERDLLARLCERETVLSGRSWLVDIGDHGDVTERLAVQLAVRLQAPVAVISRIPLDAETLTAVEVPPADADERRTAWRSALGPAPDLTGWVDRVAGQFDLGLAGIAAAAAEVRSELDREDAGPRLWDACRRQARGDLDELTERIEPRAGWPDLVLPAAQLTLLREIAAHVRHRLTVFDDWGFGARTTRGSGVAALFAGPSGTGKTYAAEVLAAELRLDLHRVDLSQVVSKYIGETEKNLRRIFDAAEAGGAVLLFDEADALFGKRSEVKDSHDRYANIEVSYLLQRMETYRGLAILTTNLKSALDSAFLRRLRFVVQFPFPDAVGRAEIWRRIFPSTLPTDGLDLATLARLSVSGGTIRNVALAAAFLAVDAGEPVRMTHVRAAARTEYAKLERPLTDAEVAGWTT